MAQLPPVMTVESTAKTTLGAAPAPPLAFPNESTTARRSSLLPRLSVMTASSLRPALVRPPSSPTAGIHGTASTESPRSPSAGAATTHPLLRQLLRVSAPAGSSEPAQSLREMAVAEAVGALGGSDAVEALLAQLNDVASQAGASNDAAFVDAVERCVQQTLAVSAVSIGAGEGGVVGLTDEEGRGSDRQAGAPVDVMVPFVALDVDAAAASALSAVHRCRSRVDRPATASASSGSYPTCLLLRIQRRRGVVALHIVNVCFESVTGESRQRRRGALLGSEGEQKRPAGVEKLLRQRRTVQSQYLPPSHRKGRAPTIDAEGNTSCFLPSFSGAEGAEADTVGGEASAISSASTNAVSRSSPFLRAGVTSRRSSVAPSKHRQGHLKSDAGLRHGNSARAAARDTVIRSTASSALFDPLRPEETTPFNAEHRPITYNAAVAFQVSL
ncbi:hypothetical protein LSCM1_04495 [Leishmania martiniquensis]|uniref:Uncharacterized protein n=1 Tax=Leishmania martiniquensis TaxID=1580590 RepID=A0A836HA38_9TRYP|nr:hypothetical protein LSCM1_04495 [Leishmania martiniquensis]